jgi:hypothetical protein
VAPRVERWAPEPCGAPGAALHREVGVGATGPHGTLGAALRWEVRAGAVGPHGSPGAALSREVGAGGVGTHGGLGATLSRELGTTPPPPPPCPSARCQGVVVPVTPPYNLHRMITWGKTGFKVVPDRHILTTVTSSLMLSPIPSSAHAALADPHWCAAMEDEYGALISNGTWALVP